MTKPITDAGLPRGARPRHRRLRMLLLVVGAAVSVLSWLAVLIWNGCVK
jgi:hypothetical protein